MTSQTGGLASPSSRLALLALIVLLSGCASVRLEELRADEVVGLRRADILSSGSLSDVAQSTLRSVAIEPAACIADADACLTQLSREEPLSNEARMSVMAEVATSRAMALTPPTGVHSEASAAAWLDVARYAYGYLFLSERAPSARAFEERQNQIRDYYNRAAQHIGIALTERASPAGQSSGRQGDHVVEVGGWSIAVVMDALSEQARSVSAVRMVPSAGLRFKGLNSVFRSDGFGSEMVVELHPSPPGDPATPLLGSPTHPYSLQRFIPVSLVVDFPARDLDELLETRRATLRPFDPYATTRVTVRGQTLPLAANFSAGYGLWLARSAFARQAALTLFGREGGIERPHIYLMQQFDPKRRILLMVHGLASSPEAWVNLANEVTGDAKLREHYQIWQVYYPTNLPIPWNHHEIRGVVAATLDALDPQRVSNARNDIVVVGHSMGGVIARLMVSQPGDQLSSWLERSLPARSMQSRLRDRLQPYVRFEPFPGVRRAVFMAAPHQGTPAATGRLARFVSRLIRTPLGVQRDIIERVGSPEEALALSGGGGLLPTSIDSLRDSDAFVQAAADIPIDPAIPYHSIIGAENLEVRLTDATDGVVPYRSAHVEGALSELIVRSDHHVQERLESMLELRRILRLHLKP